MSMMPSETSSYKRERETAFPAGVKISGEAVFLLPEGL